MVLVDKICHIEGHKLHVIFNDGVDGEADLSDYEWKGMLQPLSHPDFFRHVYVEHGAPTWPNGVDMAPEFFYKKVTGHYPKEEAHG